MEKHDSVRSCFCFFLCVFLVGWSRWFVFFCGCFCVGCGVFFYVCLVIYLFMRVLVDSRESGVRCGVALHGFSLEGCVCSVELLDVGDYLVDGVVVWEYKTVSDFLGSLFDESLFNEVFNQSERYPFSFLIVEGDFRSFLHKQFFRLSVNRKQYYHNNVNEYVNTQMKIINGAIRRCRTVCNVINLRTQAECLNEILEQSRKCLDFKGYGGVVRPNKEYNVNPCKAPLMELKGVGDKISDKIIDEFGLGCLNDLSNISYDDLLSVSGVNESVCDNFWLKVYGYVPEKEDKENEREEGKGEEHE